MILCIIILYSITIIIVVMIYDKWLTEIAGHLFLLRPFFLCRTPSSDISFICRTPSSSARAAAGPSPRAVAQGGVTRYYHCYYC